MGDFAGSVRLAVGSARPNWTLAVMATLIAAWDRADTSIAWGASPSDRREQAALNAACGKIYERPIGGRRLG